MRAFLTALLLSFSFFAQADMVDTYQFQNQADRTRAVALAKSLRCPQCQNQNLVESNSPIAYDLRLEVYKMVDEGKTNQQIIDTMTARFGNFVNYKPPFQWNTALLWLLPVGLLALALLLLYHSIRRKSSLPPPAGDKTQRVLSVGSANDPTGEQVSEANLRITARRAEGGEISLHNVQQISPPSAFGSSPRKQGERSVSEENKKHDYRIIAIIIVLLIAIPLGYYFSLERFTHMQEGEQAMISQRNKQIEMTDFHKTEDVIGKIQDKLRANPNNAETWLQLGEAYVQNNEFDYALIAYGNAEKLSGSKPNILGAKATALYYQAGERVTPKVEQLLNEALAQDKNEVSSLSLLATIALGHREYDKAGAYLQQLLDSGNAAVDRRSVIQRIKMLEFLQRGEEKGATP